MCSHFSKKCEAKVIVKHIKNCVSNFSPHVGTSSSADDVCSSVEGFFLPRLMIFVIFFPVTRPTVPFCSDLEFFFPLAAKKKAN